MALTDIGNVNGLPRNSKRRSLSFSKEELDLARANNQFVIFGTDPIFPREGFDSDYVVFLEAVYQDAAGVFTIEGSKGVVSGSIPAPFVNEHAPVRLDGGVKLNGTIRFAKGFFVIVGSA